MNRSISFVALAVIILSLFLSVPAAAQEFTAKSLADYGNVTVMEVTGGYDAKNPDGTVNSGPRKTIANEFFRTHKDEYDFLVVFSNFDFPMPDDGHAKAFYMGVKNDTHNIGITPFNYSQAFGSTNEKLQGMMDMGNLRSLATDPMDPKFNETLYLLSHELMHRWGAHAKFRAADGSDSTALLGKDLDHWSFLLDSGGSLLYGNRWRDNGNGTFTSLAPQNEMKVYSPLDLYLMGMIDRSKVPPMLLINSPGVDPGRLPEAGVTVSGTARTVTIDDIIAALGPRDPDASTSQKSFKTAFIYITQPGTIAPDSIYQIENIRNGFVTRHSILTDGQSIVQVAPTSKDDLPTNPGILPPSTTPRTSPANISEGVQWLQANQKSDGSWADLPQTEERDTAQAVLVLRNFLDAQTNYGYGLQRLGLSTSGNTDFLCRKIEAYAAAKQDTADLLSELLARRNRDGGWGSDRLYQSNPADTALALKALALAGHGDRNIIAPAISYLSARQNTSDGGWGPDDNSSTLQFTAAVLLAYNKYRGSYQLEDQISRGMTLIASRQNTGTDKGFGNSPSTVYDTATAVLVLRELGASTDITNNGLDYIRGQQGGDGSWNGSAFQTAMAIDAVYKGTVDPDLSIKTADISFIPTTITNLPTNVVIEAKIWNLGQTAVSQATVALYKDSVTEANKIAEQVVAFPGQQATTVTFSTSISSGNEHRLYIVVDPANLVKESSKANNSAAAIIAAEATYDLEVLSQDITLSANPVDMFQDVTITAKITNKGTMNAYNAQAKYFIDDATNPFAIATTTINVPAGATVTDSVTWRANKSGVNMPLTVAADPLNTFSELSETNNQAATTITVNADMRANITVSYKDIVVTPGTAMQGGDVSLSALVKNEGASPAGPVTVNFFRGVPGQNSLLLGTRTISSLAPGESSGVSLDWTNIPESGEKIIFVQASLENGAAEVRTDDNNAFVTLNILSLPDLAISTNSITFSPAFPKDNDMVTIVATIQNGGEQSTQDVVVQAFEGSALIGTRTIAAIPGLLASTATFTYNTTGKQGTHEITVIIDPENIVTEQNKSNNRASRTFGVQNANLWVTEQYLSPNGDGVKESTQLFFRLETPRTVTVRVVDQKGEAVRTFSGTGLQNVDSASVEWNGLNDGGMLVEDGSYLIELRDAAAVIGSLTVIVDTNRSPFLDAIGTNYLLNSNLTCMLPDSRQWKWFPDDSGIMYDIRYTDPNAPDFPSGLYSISSDGQDVLQLVAEENADFNYAFGYEQSRDGEKIAYIRGRTDPYRAFPEYVQLVVMDRDGTHAKPVVSFDYASGVDIYWASWSPRGDVLVYLTYSDANMLELWRLNADGTSVNLDTRGIMYSDNIRWSPDGSRIAYVFGSIDENYNYREVVRVVDLAGNKRDIAAPDDYATTFYIRHFEWLNTDRVILQDGNIIRLLDMSDRGAHASIVPNEYVNQIIPSPAGNLFAFVSGGYNIPLLSIADGVGSVFERQARTGTGNCVPSLNGITWSQDGEKLAFSERLVTCGDCSPACIDPYGPRVIVRDTKTRQETSFAHAMEPTKWLSDGRTLLGVEQEYGDYGWVTRVNSLNILSGGTKSLSLPLNAFVRPSENLLSPHENSISYYQWPDPSSTCYGRGYEDVWTLSSLLNLTADLRLLKERSAVVLRGTATDLNFDGYQLDYADEKSSGVWNPIAPPSNVPVINDLFTVWGPPYEGTFSVRLTVWDKSGNRAVNRRRVSWGISSSITNLYKSREIFSPIKETNGVKDTVELHYRALEPVHLEFGIYDEANTLVKTYYKDHASPAVDFIQWDGTNESLQAVPDGKYKIKVFEYEFFIVVDRTPPQVAAAFGSIYKAKDLNFLAVDLRGYAFDKNIKTWTIEYGTGDNPQDWRVYNQGNTQLAAVDAKGDIIDPLQEKTIAIYAENGLVPLIGAKLKLTVEDYAGNKSSAITGYLEETIIFDRYVPGREGTLKILSETELQSPLLYMGDTGKHIVGGLSTFRGPVSSRSVQYGQSKSGSTTWTDAVSGIESRPSGMFMTEWTNPGVPIDSVRIREVDDLGNAHYSNIIRTSYGFGVNLCAMKAIIDLFEELQSLKLQIQSDEDARYSQWTDVMVFSGYIPKEFGVSLPNDLLTGKYYHVKLTAIPVKGAPFSSESMQYPPADCKSSMSFTLAVKYQEPDCGLSPGMADVAAELTLKESASIAVKTLRYYLKKPAGPELARQYDLTREPWGGIMIDTKALQEGFYPVQAVLEYVKISATVQDLQEISADGTIVVDRVLPAAQITYPVKSSMLCPVKNTDVKGDWYGLSIEGIATDNNAIQYYELYYGVGENPAVWLPAETRVSGKSVAIKETKSVQGRLGIWNVSDLHGTSYSLKLKVVDAAGNVSCYTTSFSLDTLTGIANLAIDRNLFSPTGNGTQSAVTAGFAVAEQTVVDVKIFKLAQAADGAIMLEGAPIRTIVSGEQYSAGNISVAWNGKVRDTDADPVFDGKYGIAVNATDACGNTAMKWIAVEIDNAKPVTVITSPQQGITLGNTVLEIKGTAADPHFQEYTLARSFDDGPENWIPISSSTIPVRGSLLGTWNTGTSTGPWTLRLAATDRAGNKNEVKVSVILAPKTTSLIKKLDSTQKFISPNNDGKLESTDINYELDAAADVKIEIVDSGGTVRYTHTEARPSAGIYSYNYRGQADATGMILEGLYAVRLTATNSIQTQSETITLAIDKTMPVVDMTSPKDKSFLSVSDLAVIGSVSDDNMAEYDVGYSGIAGNSLIDQGSQPRSNYTFGTLNAISEGDYALAVRARDLGEIEYIKNIAFTIDRTPPAVKLDTPKNGEYYGGAFSSIASQSSSTIIITGSLLEKNLDTFNLRYRLGDAPAPWYDLVTGTTVTAYPSPYAWNVASGGVNDGVYTLSLFAKDKAGLTGESKVKITIDNTPPTVAFTMPKEGDYIKSATDITGTADDLNFEKYTLELSEGRCENASKWGVIGTGAKTVQGGVLLPWKALPKDGEYCLRLTAMDKSGNKAETEVNFLIDTHPPAAPSLTGTVENKTDARLAWPQNAEPDVAGYNLYRNNQKMNSSLIAELSYLDQGLTEGVYSYTLKAVDQAGWESVFSNEVKLRVDVTGPSARLRSPQDGGTVSGLIDIKGTAYSADDFKQYRVFIGQGAAPSTWTLLRTSPLPVSYGVLAQWDTLGIGEGQSYSLKLEAEDTSGNITMHQVTVTIDNTPPAKPVIISATGLDVNATVTWNTNAETDLAGYLLYRNGQLANVKGVVIGDLKPYLIAPTLGTTVYVDRSLPDGTYKYYIIAMDKAGNEGPSSDIREVTIETRPPHVLITDPLNAAQIGGKVLVKAESADLDVAEVTFEFKTMSGDWQPFGTKATSQPYVIYFEPAALNLGYGVYQLRAKAIDKNQNRESDTSLSTITVTYKDLMPPAAPSGLAAVTNGDAVTLSWTANTESDLNGYNLYRTANGERIKINAAVIPASPNPGYQDLGLYDGTYIYEVFAVDGASNESKPSNKISVTVYAPVLSQPQSPTGKQRVRLTGNNAAVNSLVELAQNGISVGTVQADRAGQFQFDATLAEGSNNFSVRAADNTGNLSRVSDMVTVIYAQGPAAPAGIVATEIPEGAAMHVTWDVVTGTPAGYNLYRSDTAGGPYSKLNSGLLTKGEYDDTGLINGKSYYYVVAAVDTQDAEGEYSQEAAGVPRDAIAPGKPYIDKPVRSGGTSTVFSSVIDITGRAEKDASVELFRNGVSYGKVIASGVPDEQSYQFPESVHSTALSPDERTVAYSIWRGDSGELWIRSLETGEHSLISANGSWPVWSPDGSRLLYSANDINWNRSIWLYTMSDDSSVPLTGDADVNEYVQPVWSPDGSKIAFTSNRITGTYGIWMKDFATGDLEQITDIDESHSAIFSPDGSKLAYLENAKVIVLDLSSMTTTVVEDDSAWGALSWSPDSKKLSLISYRNGYGDVYTYSLDTQKWVQVTNLASELYYDYAVWSPDGTRLVLAKWDDWSGSYILEVARTHIPGQVEVLRSDIAITQLERMNSGYIAYSDNNAMYKLSFDGKFAFSAISLDAGTNPFIVKANDASNNMSIPSDVITVTRDDSRLPDLTASRADVYLYPPMPIAGEQMAVNAVVWNKGATDAYDVDVLVYLWNAHNELELLKTERIPLIAAQSAELVSAVWDSTGKVGANRIVVVVDVDDRIVENDETDNMAIRDFFVADHEGITLTAALDAVTYGSNKNVAITVTARNSGPGKNAVLETRIEDGNGYPVTTFGPKTIAVNYASESVQTYYWNTGTTFAATYIVRTLLKEGTTVLAESTAPLVILPDSATKATLLTDKAAYGANEPVTIVATIGNEGKNWIIPTLRSQLTIKDAAGGVLLSEEKTFVNLLPGTELSHATAWNTGLSTAGDYTATLEVTAEGTAPLTRSAAFTIRESAVLTGTLSVAPDVASFGGSFQAAYTLANSGNADTGPFMVQISVIDPDTLAVMGVHEEQIAVVRSGFLSGQVVFDTASYGLKKYTVLLRRLDGNVTGVLASASMTVKDMTPPTMTILSPVAGTPNTTTVSFLVVAADDASGVDRIEYSRDGGSWSLLPISDPSRGRFGTTWEPTMADNGMHTVGFRAVDRAGNPSEETMVSYEVRINRAPTAPSPAWPATGQDVGTVRPEIAVNNASDPNGDSLNYVFELYADSDLTVKIVPAGVIPEGTGTTAWSVPMDLTENSVYYWRVQAYDGKLYGPWTDTASFRVNAVENPPSVPTPTSPADKSEVATLTPILMVINAVDPDSTSLTYNFQVALDPAFITIVTSTGGVIAGEGQTSWQVPVPLSEDVRYYWRAQADDWTITGEWSLSSAFTVNTGNNAPTVPSVVAPANGSEATTTAPDIVLQNSIDPDSPIIMYNIELDTVRTFDSPALLRSNMIPQGQGTTLWHVDGLLDNKDYFVRAKASDGAAESGWSAVTTFFVNTRNDAPSMPVSENPSNGAGVNVFTPTLSVRNSTDLDRDVLTYDFEVYEDPSLTAPAVASVAGVVETQGSTSGTVSAPLLENRTYYWRTRAFDGELASEWTTTLSFTVNTGNDAPGAPMIVSPAEGGSVDSTMPTLTVLNATDPDSTRLTYDFEVFYGSALIWSATGIAEGTTGSTSAMPNVALTDNTVYSWRCRANDGQREGPWTAMTSFTVHLQQTGIKVDIEVEPETLSQKSKGNWVMVEIELPHGYKAEDVDISSIRLEGTVRVVMWPHERKKHHHEHGCDNDHREHEHGELKVKFRRSEVIAVLPAGNHVPVHITGTVAGTPFEGVDIIKVIH